MPRALDGLPVVSGLEERVSRAVLVAASVWFALVAGWELFGPLLAGHFASSASVGIIAENMLRWHIPGAVWEYTTTRPSPSMYYCHHPWGIFWATAGLMKLLGRHDYLCRLAPALLSAVTPPLLYALGRAIWRPAAGAAAAAGFVVLPIALAFASFNALEVPVIAWTLLSLLGYVRLTQTWRRRWLAVSVLGTFAALHADWPSFVLVGELLGFGLLRAYALRRVPFGPVNDRRYAQWWVLTASTAVLTFGLYLVLFRESGKLDDLLGAYGMRSAGNEATLAQVLAGRRYWIELSFTPIAIFLGKVGAVVCVLRLLVLRREHEVLPLLYLAMCVFQYVVFKQGADIHVFWPHCFAAYFALALGALTATLVPVLEGLAHLVAHLRDAPGRASRPGLGAAVALGVALVPAVAIARDGVPALVYSRGTGGRFNEKGLLIHSDGAKTAFLRHLDATLPRTATVALHEGMKPTWSQVWTMGGRPVQGSRPLPAPGPGNDVYLADTRFLLGELQAQLVKGFHVTAVGPFWKVAHGEAPGPIDAFAIVESEPPWWEWYLVSGTEPHRAIVADPFLTWELRTHFDQPAEVPTAEPRTFDEQRIAHNVAVARGDAARAAELDAAIEAQLRPLHVRFDDGTELVGALFHDGARPLLTLVLRAAGPAHDDVQLTVKSKVLAPAPLSMTLADPLEREVGIPLGLAPQRWRKGFLYADPVPIRKRPGTEVFRASFYTRGGGGKVPRREGAVQPVDVLTLR